MDSVTNHSKIIIMVFAFCFLFVEASKAQTDKTWAARFEKISFKNISEYSGNQLFAKKITSKEMKNNTAVAAKKAIVPDFFTWTILIAFAFDRLKLFSKWTIRLGYLAAGIYLLAQSHLIAYFTGSCSFGNLISSVASLLLLVWLAVVCLQLNKLKT